MGKHYIKDRWKPLPFCYWKYQVSNLGKVKSVYSISKTGILRPCNTILKTTVNDKGYEKVRIHWLDLAGNRHKKTMAVHRLVAMMFVANKEKKPEVNHKDLNKLNNAYWNLEWVTPKENTNHAQINGARPIAKPYFKKGYAKAFKPIINVYTNEVVNSDVLSVILGIRRQYINRYLNGERPIPDKFKLLKDYKYTG